MSAAELTPDALAAIEARAAAERSRAGLVRREDIARAFERSRSGFDEGTSAWSALDDIAWGIDHIDSAPAAEHRATMESARDAAICDVLTTYAAGLRELSRRLPGDAADAHVDHADAVDRLVMALRDSAQAPATGGGE